MDGQTTTVSYEPDHRMNALLKKNQDKKDCKIISLCLFLEMCENKWQEV